MKASVADANERETTRWISMHRFTLADVEEGIDILVRDGIDPQSITITFGQRHDLSDTPWQLHFKGRKTSG